jgi:hypothetical protein
VSAVLRPLAAALAVAAVLTTACSGAEDAGGTEPERYAQAVCTGLVGWRDGVAGDSRALTTSLGRAADVATVRDRYSRFFAGTVRRTDQLIGTVTAAGAPDADHGNGYARDLTAALRQARAGLAAAQQKFAALPTTDLAAYAAGARAVRDSLGTLFTQVGGTLDQLGGRYTDSGLNRAFRDDPACQRLGST